MKINFKNVCYPNPILSELLDDFVDNKFNITIVNQQYDKKEQKMKLYIDTQISNGYINRLIEQGKVVVALHLEQKTQRQVLLLNCNDITEVELDLYKYATTESIEMVAILYTKEKFTINDKAILNNVYDLLGDEVEYERGDILGYSNEHRINLPEDKRIGSIFNVTSDDNNILDGQPFKVLLNSDLIQVLMDSEMHQKYIAIYKRDQYVKRLVFFNIVEPAIISAYTEMFMAYELYKDKKWCRTLAAKVENKLEIKAEEIFTKDNYDVDKVYKFTNYALGDLFKDGIELYKNGVIDQNG